MRKTGPKPKPLAERFWPKVERRGPNECWPWAGSIKSNGYGQIASGGKYGKPLIASRVAWELTNGPIPYGLFVCHTCDNRWCVNPAHLFLGTIQDNNEDRHQKGRSLLCGTRQITAKEAKEIYRRAHAGENQREIAKDYDVGRTMVAQIKRRARWKHIHYDAFLRTEDLHAAAEARTKTDTGHVD